MKNYYIVIDNQTYIIQESLLFPVWAVCLSSMGNLDGIIDREWKILKNGLHSLQEAVEDLERRTCREDILSEKYLKKIEITY